LLRIIGSRETLDVLLARIAAVLTLLGGVGYAAIGELGGATVSRHARRDVAFSVTAECDLATVVALAERHPDVRQFVVMATTGFGDTRGTVEVAVRTEGGRWRCQHPAATARFGRSGTRPLLDRRSGDGTTPAGVFPLGDVTAWDGQRFGIFGNRPDPGVLAPYRAVRPEDCWGATKHTARYQHLVNLPGCAGPADEWLPRFGDVYSHAAVIGANLDPVSGDEPGETPYAAAIFLHRHSYSSSGATRPTSGCVSLAYDQLVTTIRLLDPRLEPHFAIGPRDWLRSQA
jgi:L,D-peptidoglycan transpeptidase YkuD (ErfK/YbiS/YcfS/YnhG family)